MIKAFTHGEAATAWTSHLQVLCGDNNSDTNPLLEFVPSIHTNNCLLSRDCSHSSPPQLWYLPEQDRSSDPANVATSLPSRAEQTAHDGIFLFRQPLVCLENSCTHCTNAGVPSPGHWETVYNSLGKLSWSNSEVLRLRSCCRGQVMPMKINSNLWVPQQAAAGSTLW